MFLPMDTHTDRNGLVVKSNALVNALMDLSLQGQRFFAFAISQLPRDLVPDGKHIDLEINVREFGATFEIDQKNAYTLIESLADRLQRKIIALDKGKGRRVKVGLITKQEYLDGEGRAWIRFDEDLVPHICNLKSHFTPYRLKDVYQFARASTWRVYELLRQYKDVGKREIDLEDFKAIVGVSGLYSIVADLRKRVIDPAISEINAVSDLLVQWEQIKRGRKISGLRFFIKDNPGTKTPREKVRAAAEKQFGPAKPKNTALVERLTTEFKIAPHNAARLVQLLEANRSQDEIDAKLARIKAAHEANPKDDLGGYSYRALKNWALDPTLPGV